MQIRIRNRIIAAPVIDILKQAKSELTNGKLADIQDKHNGNLIVSCPVHKNGLERNASCMVLTDTDVDLEAGFAHCFTCGYNAPMKQFISDLFDEDEEFGEDWLIERFGHTLVSSQTFVDNPIELNVKKEKTFLDPSVLTQYDYYHPYMWYRKLTQEVVDRFRIGYDSLREAITFPVYDEHNRLVMVTARSVNTKRFWIPKGVDKPVYLLNDLINRNITSAFITEAQLDALTAFSWGYPTIATMGSPSKQQIQTINKSGIRSLVAIFDNDESGRRFTNIVKSMLSKDILFESFNWANISHKDINDFSKEEFDFHVKQQSLEFIHE